MGTEQSKESNNSGDPQVQVLNRLEIHEEQHKQHEFKLTIILVIVSVQLLITVYKLYKEHTRAQALKAAKTISDLTNI